MSPKRRHGKITKLARQARQNQYNQRRLSAAVQRGLPQRLAVNVYQCTRCKVGEIYVHRDAGVTPMLMTCPIEGCGGRAVSLMYPDTFTLLDTAVPTREWYRAGKREYQRLSSYAQDHHDQGGLFARDIGDDLVHELYHHRAVMRALSRGEDDG